MAFNFEFYLSKVDPSQKYKCQSLTGGLVNLTIRATKLSPFVDDTTFPKHDTLILKYAPPFVAAIGETAPFSQDRQVRLSTFISHMHYRILICVADGGSSSGPIYLFSRRTSSDLGRPSSVSVPELLYHSQQEHVLVFQDLGPSLTLYEYLAAISNTCIITFTSTSALEACLKIGLRIGEFFARLHSPNSLEQVSKYTSGDVQNLLSKDLVLEAAVMTIKDYLTRFNIPGTQPLHSSTY